MEVTAQRTTSECRITKWSLRKELLQEKVRKLKREYLKAQSELDYAKMEFRDAVDAWQKKQA